MPALWLKKGPEEILLLGANPDGIFGNDTENAVKWMQRKWNINDDGIVGPNTWAKLLGL